MPRLSFFEFKDAFLRLQEDSEPVSMLIKTQWPAAWPGAWGGRQTQWRSNEACILCSSSELQQLLWMEFWIFESLVTLFGIWTWTLLSCLWWGGTFGVDLSAWQWWHNCSRPLALVKSSHFPITYYLVLVLVPSGLLSTTLWCCIDLLTISIKVATPLMSATTVLARKLFQKHSSAQPDPKTGLVSDSVHSVR